MDDESWSTTGPWWPSGATATGASLSEVDAAGPDSKEEKGGEAGELPGGGATCHTDGQRRLAAARLVWPAKTSRTTRKGRRRER